MEENALGFVPPGEEIAREGLRSRVRTEGEPPPAAEGEPVAAVHTAHGVRPLGYNALFGVLMVGHARKHGRREHTRCRMCARDLASLTDLSPREARRLWAGVCEWWAECGDMTAGLRFFIVPRESVATLIHPEDPARTEGAAPIMRSGRRRNPGRLPLPATSRRAGGGATGGGRFT